MDEWTVKVCNSYCYECGQAYDEENFGSHHKKVKLQDEEGTDISSHEKVDKIETSKSINSNSLAEEKQQESTEPEPLLVPEINDIPTKASTQIQHQDAEMQTEDLDKENQTNPGMMISIECPQNESFSHKIYVPPKLIEESSRNTSVHPTEYTLNTSKWLKEEPGTIFPCSSSSPNIQVQTKNKENNTIGVGNSTTSTCTCSSILNVSKLKSYLHCSKCYETFSQISTLIEHFDKCNVERDVTLKEWNNSQLKVKDASTSTPTISKKDASVVTAPIKVAVVNNGSMTVLRFGEKEIPIPHLVPRIESNLSITKHNLVHSSQQTEDPELLLSDHHNDDDITNDITNDNTDGFPTSPLSQVDVNSCLGVTFAMNYDLHAIATEDGKFKCSKCSKVYKAKYQCQSHFTVHLNAKRYKCQFCHHRCNYSKTLLVHLKNKHRDGEAYKCFRFLDTPCELTFPTLEELQAHMKSHPRIKKAPSKREYLPCSKCGKRISSGLITLEEHEKTCDYILTDEDSDQEEAPSPPSHPSRPRKKFTCVQERCTRTFYSRLELNRHIVKQHEGLHPVEYERRNKFAKYVVEHDGKRWYKCPHCPTMLSTGPQLKNHMIHHNPNRAKFICSVEDCGKEFVLAVSLTAHTKKIHEGIIDQFLCSVCGACLQNRNTYRDHMRSHGTEKPYKCPFEGCEKAFHSRNLLSSHKISHTRHYQFICQFCKKAFRSNYKRRLHVLTHTEDHPFKCKFCHSSFRLKGPLNRHIRTTHPDEAEGLDLKNT